MNGKLIYIVAFVGTFLLVTGGIYYLNSSYSNIFAFDFTPIEKVNEKDDAKKKNEIKLSDSLKTADLNNIIDSLKSVSQTPPDTVRIETIKDTTLIDSIKRLETKLKNMADKQKPKKELKQTVNEDSIKAARETADLKIRKDSSYSAWVKKTVSLYEAMDSRRAAQIILTYSDNIAKDILFKMKKKKAAEILSLYSPETVSRITSLK